MTEETAIERLDYSKPPPGYVVEEISPDEGSDGNSWRARCSIASFERLTSGHALIAAWRHYKARNDPPGMYTAWSTGDARTCLPLDVLAEARAKAWAWYDRRHAIAARLPITADAWPRCLRWTDKECDQVDRWIADGEETAEPLWSLPSGGAAIVWPDNTPAAAEPAEAPEVGALIEQHRREQVAAEKYRMGARGQLVTDMTAADFASDEEFELFKIGVASLPPGYPVYQGSWEAHFMKAAAAMAVSAVNRARQRDEDRRAL